MKKETRAVAMARDVDTVALPVLEFSEVLDESDLLAIVTLDSESKQVAIAHRATIAPKLAEALVENGSEEVVAELLANDGAEIGEAAYSTVLKKYSDSDRIKEPMALRESLPVGIAERLVKMVSDHLQDHICTHHELPADLAGDLIMRSRERATMSLSGTDTAHALVKSLVENGRLTPSIVCRAVCMGDSAFFESAISLLSSIPLENVRTLIHDRGQLGLAALYDRTGLPKELYPVIRTAVDIGRETGYDGDDDDRERYVKQMIERVVTKFEDPGMNIDPDTLDYLLRRVAVSSSAESEAVA